MLRPILLAAPLLVVALLPASLAAPTCVPLAAAVPAPLEAAAVGDACADAGSPGSPPQLSASGHAAACAGPSLTGQPDACTALGGSTGPGALDWEVTWSGEVRDRVGAATCAPCPEPPGSIHIVRTGTNVWPTVGWNDLEASGLFTCTSSSFIASNGDVGLLVTCVANGPPPSGQWHCHNAAAVAFVSVGPPTRTTTGCQGGSVTAYQQGIGGNVATAANLGAGSTVTCRAQGTAGEGWQGTCSY